MNDEKIKEMLVQLADATAEEVRPELELEIKSQIPRELHPHRGLDTINIIVDLRISRVAAAIAIIGALVAFAMFFHKAGEGGDGVYEDLKAVMTSLPGRGATRAEVLDGALGAYKRLMADGKEVTYLGENCDFDDNNAVLMYWPVAEDRYAVVFSDLRLRTVSARMLIRLQSVMLSDGR